jgi:hypothetical protein
VQAFGAVAQVVPKLTTHLFTPDDSPAVLVVSLNELSVPVTADPAPPQLEIVGAVPPREARKCPPLTSSLAFGVAVPMR